VNMEQRFIPLNFNAGSCALTATAPASANIAPPGYYMLFLIDSHGVPSVSRMVRFSGAQGASPPQSPTGCGVSAQGTPTAPATPPAPPVVPSPPAAPSSALARLRKAISRDAAAAGRRLGKLNLRRLLARGVTVRGRAPEAGRVTYTLVVKRPRKVTFARVGKRVRAGAYSLKLRAPRRARQRLAQLPDGARVKVSLTIAFRADSGRRMRRYQGATLRR
jgi:Domain of unknown function (DUF1929)